MRISERDYNKFFYCNAEINGTKIKSKSAKKFVKSQNGKTLSDIDREFSDYVLELLLTAEEYSIPERKEIIESTADYYIKITGYQLPRPMVSALADFLLNEDITNSDCYKVSNTEYPFLTFRQLKRRNKREYLLGDTVTEYLGNVKRYNLPDKQKNTSTGNINQYRSQ